MFYIPLCWVLVFKSGLERLGAAVAISISYWLNVILLGVYMKYSPACKKTLAPISMESFQGIGEFFSLCYPFCCNGLVIPLISSSCKEKSLFFHL